LTRTGLDAVFNGPDGIAGTADDFDAILFPQNRGAAAPAKAGYRASSCRAASSAVNDDPRAVPGRRHVHGSCVQRAAPDRLAYAYEQATRLRRPPTTTPALPSDYVHRP